MSGIMDDLIARVEALAGPDMNIGREVLRACGWRQSQVGYFLGPLTHWSAPSPSKAHFDDDDFRRHDPTASLDTAISLWPKGWTWTLGENADGWEVLATTDGGGRVVHVPDAATPAIALCAAALRATFGRIGL